MFQPIVHLASRTTIGYEALVRGPAGSSLVDAHTLLRHAYRTGLVVEFDWAARAAACRGAMAARLTRDQLLFLNIEPLALGTDCPPDLWPDIRAAFERFQVVLEVTERSLDRDPRSLLEGIDRQRPNVAGIAIDDLGGNGATLSMLPVLAADVIKLDQSVTQSGPTSTVMQIMDIAYEEAERTGATILAEGVETPAHAAFAESAGATLAQGLYLGPPAPLPTAFRAASVPLSVNSEQIANLATPFDALEGRTTSRADLTYLTALSHHFTDRAAELVAPSLSLLLLPDPRLLTREDRIQLALLAQRGVVTGVLGPGLPDPPATGVRGARDHDHALDGHWATLTLSPGTASALLARAVPGSTDEFEFGVTHDRRLVVAAARCLLRRLGAGSPEVTH
ncbi:EAL domain, c-di-GMP-specific phosphodiesterase class I (or its enzymatically inactive variant) [Asanoa hainanensis]|uniref:EAL domain, c-di-GMP-specific phosphodiesterase class I (Or its enzymatically inactive variant) n=1 Tax=Asanoa hainanensis TaxID=560556 RepID=A0A239P8K9_9ACTN|nr:EAL domain, c-di-GMP-specific phosphodiesterase class I (or its enzymatically inactive variant) [Asanoa hainanensis]